MTNKTPTEIKLLTIQDLKEITGIKSYNTLKRYMDVKKSLPYRKIGRSRMFTLEDIKAFIENQRHNS